MRDLPPIDLLRAAVAYDPETGNLAFKVRTDVRPCWNTRHAGKPALHTLSPVDGYLRGYLFRRMLLAHRVIFALATGRTTFGFIDHINGNRADNRLCNLREVDRGENARNKARPSNSTTGLIGVSRDANGRYRAHITVADKAIHLGRFATAEAAYAARKAAEAKYGFHPNHGRDLFLSDAA